MEHQYRRTGKLTHGVFACGVTAALMGTSIQVEAYITPLNQDRIYIIILYPRVIEIWAPFKDLRDARVVVPITSPSSSLV